MRGGTWDSGAVASAKISTERAHQASYSVCPFAGAAARLSSDTARLVLRHAERARPLLPRRNRPTIPGYPSSKVDLVDWRIASVQRRSPQGRGHGRVARQVLKFSRPSLSETDQSGLSVGGCRLDAGRRHEQDLAATLQPAS